MRHTNLFVSKLLAGTTQRSQNATSRYMEPRCSSLEAAPTPGSVTWAPLTSDSFIGAFRRRASARLGVGPTKRRNATAANATCICFVSTWDSARRKIERRVISPAAWNLSETCRICTLLFVPREVFTYSRGLSERRLEAKSLLERGLWKAEGTRWAQYRSHYGGKNARAKNNELFS